MLAFFMDVTESGFLEQQTDEPRLRYIDDIFFVCLVGGRGETPAVYN